MAEDIENAMKDAYLNARGCSEGALASYIPELEKVDPNLFGVSICNCKGELFGQGDTEKKFTLQSVSKVPAYALALELYGEEALLERIGVEASGEDFDSIIKLDRHKRPFNPMVNAGAIAITDLIISKFGPEALEKSFTFFEKVFGCSRLSVDESVFASELKTGEKNRAIAHLLKSFNLLDNPVEEVLSLYFRHCSVQVSTSDLARLGVTLANRGLSTLSQEKIVSPENNKKILSIMLTCGMYNYAGQWFYEIGLPSKSGVSGGVLSVVPGRMGIGAFSPLIDEKGNSYRSVIVHRILSEKLNLHILSQNEVIQ